LPVAGRAHAFSQDRPLQTRESRELLGVARRVHRAESAFPKPDLLQTFWVLPRLDIPDTGEQMSNSFVIVNYLHLNGI
jgi:hypothetical protein